LESVRIEVGVSIGVSIGVGVGVGVGVGLGLDRVREREQSFVSSPFYEWEAVLCGKNGATEAA